MQEIGTPARSVGWLLLAIVILTAGFILGRLSHAGRVELVDAQKPAMWETNWPRLKQGMTKEAVLTLLGAPSSTNLLEMRTTSISVNPPNPNTERNMAQAMASLDQKLSGAIWTYYGTRVIRMTPVKDAETDFGQVAKQAIDTTNLEASFGGDMQGHAIKFDGSGRVVEISAE